MLGYLIAWQIFYTKIPNLEIICYCLQKHGDKCTRFWIKKYSNKLTESSLFDLWTLLLFIQDEYVFPSRQAVEQWFPTLLHGQKFLPLSQRQYPRHEHVVKFWTFGKAASASNSLWKLSASSSIKLCSCSLSITIQLLRSLPFYLWRPNTSAHRKTHACCGALKNY